MRILPTTSKVVGFLLFLTSTVAPLAGCAVRASSDDDPSATLDQGAVPDGDEPVGTSSDALTTGSGPRGGLGFSCENGTCTCSKGIEGDCDRMRKNCKSTTDLDTCIKGWLTTDCTCKEGARVQQPPRGGALPPRTGVFATK